MKKPLFGVFALILALCVSSPAAALPQAGPPDGWQAHPPIHVRPTATSASPSGYSPAQVRHAYGFDQLSGDGTGQTIAIVDAYDDPTAESDLQTFNTTFGLPTMNTGGPTFQKVYAQGSKPITNNSWAMEISLDVQWAHAIAPGANILLVEAASSSFSNLLGAVDTAVNSGASVVSMSWGGSDFSGESSYDYHFNPTGKKVVFTASSGDNGASAIYPAASPYVLGVGGTTLQLNSDNTVKSETAWSGSGGGISANEVEPAYQTNYPIPSTGGKRGIPDVSYDADPNTGFPVYDTTGQSGWVQVGGTSAGSPQWAALVAIANQGRSAASLSPLSTNDLTSSAFYNAATGASYAVNYRDITSGSNGSGSLDTATSGYDFVTGLGSPRANSMVPFLAPGSPPPSPDFSLGASPSSISFNSGSNGSFTVSVNPTGSFSQQVALTSSSPAGLTVTPQSTNVSSPYSSTTFTAASSTPGSYLVTITGTSGTLTHTTTVGVTVNSASGGTLSVSVSTDRGSYRLGQSGTITVTVTSSSVAVGGASVKVSVIPSLSGFPMTATTGSSGTVGFNFGTATAAHGTTYTVTATVSATGYAPGTGTTAFKVR